MKTEGNAKILSEEPLSNLIATFLRRVRNRGVLRRVREIAKEHLLDCSAIQ